MKRIVLFPLLLVCFGLSAQVPFYGSRLFVSADKQDTFKLEYPGGVPTWTSSKKYTAYKGGVKMDSIFLVQENKWVKTFPRERFFYQMWADSALYWRTNYGYQFIAGQAQLSLLNNFIASLGYYSPRYESFISVKDYVELKASNYNMTVVNRLKVDTTGLHFGRTTDKFAIDNSGNVNTTGDYYKNGIPLLSSEADPVYNSEKSQYLKTETDPVYTSEKSSLLVKTDTVQKVATKYDLSTVKTRLPVVTIKPTRDSVNYEMIGSGRSYKIPVTFTIYRPTGSATITSINIDGKAITPPALNEGATYTGTDTLVFGQSPTVTLAYKKTFQFKVVAGRDTVKQDLILGQYWKVYVGPVAYYYGSTYTVVDDYSFTSRQSELLVDGKAFLTNVAPAGQELMIGIPVEFVNKTIYVNGLPFKFTQYNTRSTNFLNARGAAHQYKGLVSQFKIKGNINSIEIK